MSERVEYGGEPEQFFEIHRPDTSSPRGTVVVIHGGFWLSMYDLSLGRPPAVELARLGWTAVNLEYRASGRGGWPGTFDDVSAGIDALRQADVDSSRVVALGHSAGGQLAVWAAGRERARVRLAGAIAQAGVLDLGTAARDAVGGRAVAKLLGGSPREVPDRYAAADPLARVPLRVPVVCVHGRADELVPFAQSSAYVARDNAAGGQAALIEVPGGHFDHLDLGSDAWSAAVRALDALYALF